MQQRSLTLTLTLALTLALAKVGTRERSVGAVQQVGCGAVRRSRELSDADDFAPLDDGVVAVAAEEDSSLRGARGDRAAVSGVQPNERDAVRDVGRLFVCWMIS